MKNFHEMDLSAFKQLPIPKAHDRKYIFLACTTSDGVGDLVHFEQISSTIHELVKDKGYELVGYLSYFLSNAPLQARIKEFVKDNCFTKLYIKSKFNYRTEKESEIKDELAAYEITYDSSHEIKKYLRKSSCLISVSILMRELFNEDFGAFNRYSGILSEIPYFIEVTEYGTVSRIPEQLNYLNTAQDRETYKYLKGSYIEQTKPLTEENYTSVPMGLGPNLKGIRLYDYRELSKKDVLKTLPRHLLDHLLYKNASENYTPNGYLQDRKFIPGYLQNQMHLNIFMMYNIKKLISESKEEKIDFYISSKYLNENLLQLLLSNVELADGTHIDLLDKVSVIKLESIGADTQIRIFCDFELSDNEYRTLYQISESGAGSSGDDTASLTFSTNLIPYHQFNHMPGKKDMGLSELFKEVNCLLLNKHYKILQEFEVNAFLSNYEYTALELQKDKDLFIERINTYSSRLAKLFVDNKEEMLIQAQIVRDKIYKDYNVYSFLTNVLKKSMYSTLQKDNPETAINYFIEDIDSLKRILPKSAYQIMDGNWVKVHPAFLRKAIKDELNISRNLITLGPTPLSQKDKVLSFVKEKLPKSTFEFPRHLKHSQFILSFSKDNSGIVQELVRTNFDEALEEEHLTPTTPKP